MLKEDKDVRQSPTGAYRRWFSGTQCELILWYDRHDRSTIVGFQFCYSIGHRQYAVTWSGGDIYSHDRVDSGSAHPFANQSPVLKKEPMPIPPQRICEIFVREDSLLDNSLRAFIRERLLAYKR